MNKSEIKKALDALSEAMNDDDYLWSWQCNLAMAYYDQGGSRLASNIAAANFLKLLFDADVTKLEYYRDLIVEERKNEETLSPSEAV